jgi:uncharacterized protein (DUF2147 family)
MKQVFTKAALALLTIAAPATASSQSLEGRWANPHHSVIVSVSPCGDAYCGTVSWANAHNRRSGVAPGTRVLSDLRAQGNGVYKGRAYEPKRGIGGSATVTQEGPNVMIVKGCAIVGLICKAQRWTRVS